jgi:NADH-quinone oxidoreductase subunit M
MNEFLDSIGYGWWILHALVLLPLLGVIPVLLGPQSSAKWTALGVTMLELVLSAGLWWALEPGVGTLQLVSNTPWIPQWGIGYRVGIDGISLVMVLLTTLMMPLSVLGSWRYITKQERGFYALMLTLLTGLVGVFIALDLFVFYVFFEVMLIPMYFIIGIWGGTNRLYAAIKFFIYTMAGSLLMLVAIVALVWRIQVATGYISFSYQAVLENAGSAGTLAPWLFAAFAIAFAIKVPIFPFHTWLPDAHVEAPTAGSVLLAAVMLKIGTYGFLRFAVPFFPDVAMSPVVSRIVVVLAVIGVIYGALVAMVQPDIKKLVAYSSVSHLGFVMLGIWGGTVQSVQGSLMVMISHGFSTGALFLLIGMIYERRHTRLIADYGGIARVVPVFSLIFTVVALSSIGLPGLNGFVGEFLILLGTFFSYRWWVVPAAFGIVLGAVYMLWAYQRVFHDEVTHEENRRIPDLKPREIAMLAPIMALIVFIGLYPKPFLDRIEPDAARIVSELRDATREPVSSTTVGEVDD